MSLHKSGNIVEDFFGPTCIVNSIVTLSFRFTPWQQSFVSQHAPGSHVMPYPVPTASIRATLRVKNSSFRWIAKILTPYADLRVQLQSEIKEAMKVGKCHR